MVNLIGWSRTSELPMNAQSSEMVLSTHTERLLDFMLVPLKPPLALRKDKYQRQSPLTSYAWRTNMVRYGGRAMRLLKPIIN